MNSLLLWVGGLLVAVLGLLFAVPHLVDWNAYRGVFEEEATRILGRDVRVGGKVNLRLLPSPYVRFEKVRISDAGAALGEPFFRAEAFTLWLSPTPLLRGAIEANEIELDQPVLRLAVDAGGNGNWQQLRITPGALPFMPSDIVLQQVRIHKGVVSLRTPSAAEPLTLSGIEGELAAASLDGPYRFRGNVDWAGVPRELRINTAQREPNGQLRYKASVRALDSGNVYALDGVLSELSARARHTGVLTAKLPLAALAADSAARNRSSRTADIFDLKANIAGDLDGLRLTDLQLAFEQGGKPQLMTGEVSANWRNGMRTETRLASRWIDLDLIAGHSGGPANAAPMPFDVVRRSIAQLNDLLPSDGSSVLTVDVDQLNLGGEALRNLRLALARTGGVTSIGELRAILPGNARAEVRGTLGLEAVNAADGRGAKAAAATTGPASGTGTATFDGELALHGASYRRMIAWATGTPAPGAAETTAPGAAGDSAFLLASRVRLQADRATLTGASLELGNRQHTGALDWRWGRERGLALAIEGHHVDLSAVAPGVLDLTALPAGPAIRPATASGSAVLSALAARATSIERTLGSFHLKLRAHSLTDGATTLNDVDADMTLRGDRLDIAGLKLATTTAARVDLQGTISAIAAQPQGHLRGWMGAAANQGVTSLLGLLPAGAYQHGASWLGRSGNADIGFALTLGGAQPGRASLRADGVIDDSKVSLDLVLDGGLANWRDGPIGVALSLDGAATTGLARRMAGWNGDAAAFGPALLRINASGAHASALTALATLETAARPGKARAEFRGPASIDVGSGAVTLSGTLQLDVADAGDLMLAAGAPRRPHLSGTPVSGLLSVERKGGTTNLATTALGIGRSRVAGQITLTERPDRMRLDGKLTADRIALLALAGLVLDGDTKSVADAGGDDAPSPWPDASFSLGLLERMEGQLTLTAPVATLADGLELADASLEVGLSPGRLTISNLSGGTLGGRFTARSSMEAQTAGVNLSIDMRMTGVQLARVGGGSAQPRRNLGDANLTLAMAGRASSLRAATAQLTGRGEVELRNAQAEGLGAEMVEKIGLAAIEASDAAGGGSGLQTLISQERRRSTTPIGNRRLPIEIADGIARIGVLDITTPAANLRNTTTIDIASLKADSEWRIAPRRPLPGQQRGNRKDPLPSIALVWTGSLAAIARSEPKMSTDALEREISIRRIEHETDKLEEMRRQDEERAAIEAEKLKRNQDAAATSPPTEAMAPATQPPSEAPVVPAPLPLPQGLGEAQRPPPVTRPTPRPRADSSKTLLDAIMGQQ